MSVAFPWVGRGGQQGFKEGDLGPRVSKAVLMRREQ